MKKVPENDVVLDFDLDIDINALDQEWLKQPKLFHQWSLQLAEARIREDEAKQKLELTKSECEKEIRESPEAYELMKSTESEISACVIRQPEFGNAQKNLNNARHRTSVLAAGVAALDHRRRALENLVELFGMDYFSEPTARGERAKEHVSALTKRNSRKRAKFNKYHEEESE